MSGSPSDFPNEVVLKYLPNANLTVLETQKGAEKSVATAWRGKGKRAGRNFIATKQEIPNDPLYSFQWHFKAVQAEAAWGISKGAGVTVAVLDTGVDYTHAAMGGEGTVEAYNEAAADVADTPVWPQGKVIGGYDFVNGDIFITSDTIKILLASIYDHGCDPIWCYWCGIRALNVRHGS